MKLRVALRSWTSDFTRPVHLMLRRALYTRDHLRRPLSAREIYEPGMSPSRLDLPSAPQKSFHARRFELSSLSLMTPSAMVQ